MRSEREADPSPVRELRGLEAPDQRTVEGRGLSLRVEAPRMALRFGDERATKAVLSFLRKTKVGQIVTIPPRDEAGEEGGEEGEEGERVEVEGEEGGPGPPT